MDSYKTNCKARATWWSILSYVPSQSGRSCRQVLCTCILHFRLETHYSAGELLLGTRDMNLERETEDLTNYSVVFERDEGNHG